MDSSDAWTRAAAVDLTLDEALQLAKVSASSLSTLVQNGSAPREALVWIYGNYPSYALDVCTNLNAPPEMKMSVPFRMHSHAAVMRCLEDLGCIDADFDEVFRVAEREPESPLRTILLTAGLDLGIALGTTLPNDHDHR